MLASGAGFGAGYYSMEEFELVYGEGNYDHSSLYMYW
jgi:hypothetical protein